MEFIFGSDQRRETRNLEELTPSTREVLDSAFDSAFDDNPVSRMMAYSASREEGRGAKLSREEIHKRAKDQGAELKEIPEEGLSAYGAQVLIDRQIRKRKNDAILSDDRLSFGQGVLSMGAGFAAGTLDPVNMALNFVPFVGSARQTALLAKAGGSIAGRAGVRVGLGAAEGAGGAALTEAAINYPLAQELGEDYGTQNVLQNIFYGAAFGGGLRGFAGLVSDAVGPSSFKKPKGPGAPDGPLPASPELRGAPDVQSQVRALGVETHEKAASTAVAHLVEGKDVEVNPIIDAQTAKYANDIENTRIQEPSQVFDQAALEAKQIYDRGLIEGRIAKEPTFTPEDRIGFDRSEYATLEEAAQGLQQKVMAELQQGNRLYLTANKQNYLILGEENGRLKVIEPNDVNGFFIDYKDLADRPDFAVNSKEVDYYGGERAKRIAEEVKQERSGKGESPDAPKSVLTEMQDTVKSKVAEPENAMFMDKASDESLTASKAELEAEPEKVSLEKSRVDSDNMELEAEIKELQKQMGEEIVLEEVPAVKQADEKIKQARDFGAKLKLLAGCALRRGAP
jgi:hypothetical protein